MKKFKKIYIEITNFCNLNCSFCSKDNRVKKEMSIDEFEYILKSIDDYTDYIYLHIKGEPLLHSKLNDILKLCSKYKKFVNITTNGTLLNKKLPILLNNDIRQINISLHNQANDINIIECINKLTEKMIVVLRFWTEDNNELLNQILNIYNVDGKRNKLKENLFLSKGKYFTWPSLKNKFVSETGTCYGLKTHIGILSDGTVVPCCLDSEGIINLGNIFDTKFSGILESNKTINIINGFNQNKLVEEMCRKCSFRKNIKNK